MNCNDVIPLLSPFHDGQLPQGEHRVVAEHVAACAACSKKLESIRRLSDLVESTPAPDVPGTLLAKIERSLDSDVGLAPASWFSPRSRGGVAALVACTAAILGGLMVWQISHGPSHSHEEMVRVFGEFLDSYEVRPASALELLAQRYQGTLISEAAATSALKRPTIARPVILASHQVAKRYLLKMPCCDCVQTIYAKNGETSIVLFEHEKEQTDWFHARPLIRTECRGKACCLVQLKDCLAATWPVDGGYVTALGIGDVGELDKLVEELQPL